MDSAYPYTSFLTLNGGAQNWSINNKGIPGETLTTMLANAPTNIDPWFNPNVLRNVVIIWAGTNDIANAQQPANVYANLVSYVAARHAKGWKVVVVTMLSRIGWDQKKDAYNALILANTAGADAVVDFGVTPLGIDNGYANPQWFFQDGIHVITVGVSTYEAPMISTGVNSIP